MTARLDAVTLEVIRNALLPAPMRCDLSVDHVATERARSAIRSDPGNAK
jgi:hypothetical protein